MPNSLWLRGKAYYAFDSVEQLDTMRQRQRAMGVQAPKYNAITRMAMDNAFTLSKEEVTRRIAAGQPHVVRMQVNPHQTVRFHDQVRGWVQVKGASIDDKVLLKEDGMPTYHFANVVDDHLMQISHVIRGEEWLPSTPLHVLLYEAFTWPMPIFAHLPLLLRSNGQGKLSKRMASQEDAPIFPIAWEDPTQHTTFQGFREAGYLPAPFLNFIALLGWHPQHQQEILSYADLCRQFSLDNIHKAGVRVDAAKAKWFNQQYLKNLPLDRLVQYLLPTLPKTQQALPLSHIQKIAQLVRDRLTFPQDLWAHHAYFFVPPKHYPMPWVAKKWTPSLKPIWQALLQALKTLHPFQASLIAQTIQATLQENEIKASTLIPLLRMATTGSPKGPELPQILEILGPAATIERLEAGLKAFEHVEEKT